MIRFPDPHAVAPFDGTALDHWVSAPNVHSLLTQCCKLHGQRTAITFVESGEPTEQALCISYATLLQCINRTANLFRQLGVARDDSVAFMLPSLPQTQFVLWGAEAAGVAMPINFLLEPQQIAELLRQVGCRVLVALGPSAQSDIWQKALAVREQLPDLKLVQVGGAVTETSGAVDFATEMAWQPGVLTFEDRPTRSDVAAYFHTGGTTGVPRLVTHTHENQIAAAYGSVTAAGLTSSEVMGNGFPMFHVAGTIFCGLAMLTAGANIVLLSAGGFRNPHMVRNYWRMVERYRMTMGGGIPTAVAAILQTDASGFDLSSLNRSMSGGASLPRAVAEAFERVSASVIVEGYGMTETAGMISLEYASRPHVIGSVGHPIPFCQVQARCLLADGTLGTACAAGEAGVFVVRGPQVTRGYVNPLHNEGMFTADGWFITGDIGYLDDTGRLFITGRAKDVIIRSGHNIDPLMIEEAFLAHPGVLGAAAVAMPDCYAGEVPVVYVALKVGATATAEELLAFAQPRIHERPAYPKRLFFVDQLPLTSVGKVYKPALRRDCAEQLFREVLSDESISTLSLTENAQRQSVLVVQLDALRTQQPHDCERIREKMHPFGIRIECK